ncbi:MAG: 2-dehydropantoate 2-reductase [Longimicrobiales bacterium]|nr:2-dehydropantoate 2-reductase [Longimicrobiales bacterium]
MRVVVVGAGGLGSYVGAVLSRAGHDVTLVTRGDHRTMIEAEGLRVRSHAGDFVVHPSCVGSALELERADLAFLGTKTFSLDEVAPQLVHLAGTGAYVVSLLNGVTAWERLVAHGIPEDQVADGVAYMTSFRVEPGVVERRAAHQRIVMGENAAASVVEETFRDTLVEIETARHIRVELWEKMCVVCSLAVLCALGERTMGSVRSHPFGADLQTAAVAEVLAVGRARGVPIPEDAEARIDEALDRFPDDFFPSVIHDLTSGRPTEMEDLGGTVARMGRSRGIPTPLHDAGTMIVQLAEARRGARPR